MPKLLLISNSTMHGRGYLQHVEAELRDFLGSRPGPILFVPFALADHAGYAAKARARFAELGFDLRSAHEARDAGALAAMTREAGAVFVGGGNTFRLLDRVQRSGLLSALRERVRAGMAYVGSSAGSNLAGPTIKTTNDMPIVQPASFEALGLVPFQLNPHFLDTDPASTHMGETREQRLREFHEENETPVVGLREGAWLRCEGTSIQLGGTTGARLFRRGVEPLELASGADISGLVGAAR